MSGETKKGKALPVSYTPPEQPGEPQMTAAQYQDQQDFFFGQVERFKKLFEDSTLAKYIVMAGVTGLIVAALEVIRVIWLAYRYLAHV